MQNFNSTSFQNVFPLPYICSVWNVRLHDRPSSLGLCCLSVASRVARSSLPEEVVEEEAVQEVIRPSELVFDVKVLGSEVAEEGRGVRRLRVTGTLGAGFPVTVSRMWVVMKGRLEGAAIVLSCCWCLESFDWD